MKGLQAAEKGYRKLLETSTLLNKMSCKEPSNLQEEVENEILALIEGVHEGMNDDFNTAKSIARLMELGSFVHKFHNQQLPLTAISESTLKAMQTVFHDYIFDVFGLKEETGDSAGDGNLEVVAGLMELIIDIRKSARTNKDWTTADKIRDALQGVNITLKDGKEGTTWNVEG
ncbi:MAG: hypothetical protein HC892_06295 [Saprospiraceae bacterium]|nr:hypothetical protein [Saprospiraceae bacterium]